MSKNSISREKIIGISIISTAVIALVLIFILLRYSPPDTKIPDNLILGAQVDANDFKIYGSSDTNYNEVVKYVTDKSLSELEVYYKNYFSQNGWQLTGYARSKNEQQIIGKKNTGEQINISINPILGYTLDNSESFQVIIIYQK